MSPGLSVPAQCVLSGCIHPGEGSSIRAHGGRARPLPQGQSFPQKTGILGADGRTSLSHPQSSLPRRGFPSCRQARSLGRTCWGVGGPSFVFPGQEGCAVPRHVAAKSWPSRECVLLLLNDGERILPMGGKLAFGGKKKDKSKGF